MRDSNHKEERAFLFSDLHAQRSLLPSLKKEIKKSSPSLLIFAGDFLNAGQPFSFAEEFHNFIVDMDTPFCWVTGNNDIGEAAGWFLKKHPTLEEEGCGFGEFDVVGVNYAGSIIPKNDITGNILVSHVPPPGYRTYSTKLSPHDTFSRTPGSFSLAPVIHICGHLHNQTGVAMLGKTKIIKMGSVASGNYALLDSDSMSVNFFKLK
ncbi:MAG TPA: metallophosphoesterase family protein [bacterium]|nr:metallophosphoesterase family protein [bacterium]